MSRLGIYLKYYSPLIDPSTPSQHSHSNSLGGDCYNMSERIVFFSNWLRFRKFWGFFQVLPHLFGMWWLHQGEWHSKDQGALWACWRWHSDLGLFDMMFWPLSWWWSSVHISPATIIRCNKPPHTDDNPAPHHHVLLTSGANQPRHRSGRQGLLPCSRFCHGSETGQDASRRIGSGWLGFAPLRGHLAVRCGRQFHRVFVGGRSGACNILK